MCMSYDIQLPIGLLLNYYAIQTIFTSVSMSLQKVFRKENCVLYRLIAYFECVAHGLFYNTRYEN